MNLRGIMKKILNSLVLATLVVSTHSVYAADMAPSLPSASKVKKAEAKEASGSKVLMSILNQVTSLKIGFGIDIGSKREVIDGVEKTVPDINFLEVKGVTKFNGDISHSFVDEKKVQDQLKKITPGVKLTTKDLFVVVNAKMEQKGSLKVRFCKNYTVGNDYCDTLADTKLLGVKISSPNFEMFDLLLKEINVELVQQISEKKFSIKGTCTAWMSDLDPKNPEKSIMLPAICSFFGEYDGKAAGDKFTAYGFKLKPKTP